MINALSLAAVGGGWAAARATETRPDRLTDIGVLGTLNIAAGVGVVIANALLAQAAHTRPAKRRALVRRGR